MFLLDVGGRTGGLVDYGRGAICVGRGGAAKLGVTMDLFFFFFFFFAGEGTACAGCGALQREGGATVNNEGQKPAVKGADASRRSRSHPPA